MGRLPRILIIDDDLGTDPRYRALFCEKLALCDAATDAPRSGRGVAEATFCSGQRIGIDDWVENDRASALAAIRRGWPFEDGGWWALVCLDVTFMDGHGRRRATAFGLDLLQMVADHPDLSGSRGARLPVVMLTTDASKAAAQKALERRASRSSERPCFFEKWSVVAEEQSAPRLRLMFTELLLREGLAEDGSLRFTDPTGAAHPIRDQKIPGQALPLLKALREARKAVIGNDPAHVLVDAESGEDLKPVAEYIHDHRKVILQSYRNMGAVSGSLRRLDAGLGPGSAPKGATFMFPSLDWRDDGEVKALLSALDSHGADAQFVVTAIGDVRGASPLAHELRNRLTPLAWPSLRDRREDIEQIFNRYLAEEEGEGQSRSTVEAGAITLLGVHEWPDGVRELRRVAVELARQGWHRHAVLEEDVLRAIESVGARPLGSTVRSFSDLLLEMENFQFGPGDKLDDAWPRLEAARGALVRSLLRAAAAVTSGYSPLATLIGFADKNRTNPAKRLLERWGVDVFAGRPPTRGSRAKITRRRPTNSV